MKRMIAIVFGLAALSLILCEADIRGQDKKKDVKKKDKAGELVIAGVLADGDAKDKVQKKSYCKIYAYKMTEGKAYQIDMKSKEISPFLRLENPGGNQVAMDDTDGLRDARIVYTAPKSGEFKIIATTVHMGSKGKFTLTVTEVIAVAVKTVELTLSKGEAKADGELAYTDSLFLGRRHFKPFVVELKADTTYRIDMKGAATDSYLVLQDPSGIDVANDDHSGGGLDAQIVYKVKATGKHRIVAATYHSAASIGITNFGPFTLTVREIEAIDPLRGKPTVSGTWKTIRAGHQLIYLGGDRVLDWEPKSGHYRIWAYDRTKKDGQNPFPGNPEVEGTWETIRGDRQLVYLGGDRVLDWEPESGRYRIWPYDRKKTGKTEPFPGDPVLAGTWKTVRAGHQLVYLGDYPRAPEVDGSPIPGEAGRILDWQPSKGYFQIWEYDRGRKKGNPLSDPQPAGHRQGTWEADCKIKTGHQLISLEGKRVLDWEPATGAATASMAVCMVSEQGGGAQPVPGGPRR